MCQSALVAQLDRAFDYGSKGSGFDSWLARHYREVVQLGRALGLGPSCCRFKSCLPDHLNYNPLFYKGFINRLVPNPLNFPYSVNFKVLILFKMLIALSSSFGIK